MSPLLDTGCGGRWKRNTGSSAIGRGAPRAGWAFVLALDARAGKRNPSADGFGAGHGQNGGRGVAARGSGLSGEGIRIGRIAPAGGESAEACIARKRK